MTRHLDPIAEYTSELFVREDDALRRIREESGHHGLPAIHIRPDEGHSLALLVRACGARRALEIGTLGGYSGTWIARALVPGGRLTTLEIDPKHAEVALAHFRLAGVADRVDLRLGEATTLLPALAAEEPFDFVFIDADKPGYVTYFDWAVAHTRSGGLIVAHNALRGGRVLDPHDQEPSVLAIRAFNRRVAEDPRVVGTIFPAGDGMTIALRLG